MARTPCEAVYWLEERYICASYAARRLLVQLLVSQQCTIAYLQNINTHHDSREVCVAVWLMLMEAVCVNLKNMCNEPLMRFCRVKHLYL